MNVNHLALILGCLICTSTLAEERIYKWTDENGEVHYTSEPPPDAEAEPFVLKKDKLPEAPPASAVVDNSFNDAPEPTPADTEDEGPTPAELKKQAAELCERGRFLVETLEPRPQAVLTQPDGSVRALSDSERQQRIDRGHRLIREYCNYKP
jgi:hypothetical protein